MISLLDHGVLFGDSLYEVVRFYDRKPLGWEEHMNRFVECGRRTGIDVASLLPLVKNRAQELLKELNESNAAVRFILTRGPGKLHIDWRTCSEPALYLAAWKYEHHLFTKPARLAIVSIRRNSRTALDPAIKSGNYLNSVLAFKEAVELGYDDAIMLNPEGRVTELTTSNLGWFQKGRAHTPHTDSGILHGITRHFLSEATAVESAEYGESDLKDAEEAFVISTFKEVLPVEEIRFSDGKVKKFLEHSRARELGANLRKFIEKKIKNVEPLY